MLPLFHCQLPIARKKPTTFLHLICNNCNYSQSQVPINKMTRNFNHPSKLKKLEEQIQPWSAQESNQLNPIQATIFQSYQPVTRHTISFNPQAGQIEQTKNKKTVPKGSNFCDNLRKYEKKKAEQISIKKNTNFIQKNKQKLIEDFTPQSQQRKNNNMLISNLFIQEKELKNFEQQLALSVQPINWSLIMYYQTQKGRRKPRHKDIQSFLRFQSQKKRHQTQRVETREKTQINQPNFSKQQQDKFQKMLKIKEGIRRRNLRSASSSSRRRGEQTQQSVDQLRQNQNYSHRVTVQRTDTSQTSYSTRIPKKTFPKPTKIEIVATKNIIVAPKIEQSQGLRMIHSSQKNRPFNQSLNINGCKVENSKKFNNNI